MSSFVAMFLVPCVVQQGTTRCFFLVLFLLYNPFVLKLLCIHNQFCFELLLVLKLFFLKLLHLFDQILLELLFKLLLEINHFFFDLLLEFLMFTLVSRKPASHLLKELVQFVRVLLHFLVMFSP